MGSSASGPPSSRPKKRVRLLYEHRISLYSFLVALPGLIVSGILVWTQPWTLGSRLALIAQNCLSGGCWPWPCRNKPRGRCKPWPT